MSLIIIFICVVIFCFSFYILYKIDERNQFDFYCSNNYRKCKKCNSYQRKDNDNDWHVWLKSSKYDQCNCYIFTKDKKL